MGILKDCPFCGKELTIETTKYFISECCEHCLKYWKIKNYKCCDNPELNTVKHIVSNGTIHAKKQCKNCGQIGESIGGYSLRQRKALPELDHHSRKRGQREYWETLCKFRNNRKRENSIIWWSNYQAYMKSDAWKEKRKMALIRDNYTCQICLDSQAEQVHHLSYDNFGNEPLEDLLSVCKPCHDYLHELKDEFNQQY